MVEHTEPEDEREREGAVFRWRVLRVALAKAPAARDTRRWAIATGTAPRAVGWCRIIYKQDGSITRPPVTVR